MSCDKRGKKDGSDAAVNQDMPEIAGNYKKLWEKQGKKSSSENPERTIIADILFLNF